MRAPVAAILATLALLGALLAVDPVREALLVALSGDVDGLRRELDALGATAALVLVGLAIVHVVIPFPAELPTAAAGFALGFAVGFPLMLAAWLASGLLAYALARAAGRPLLARIAGADRLGRAEALVASGGAGVLLVGRLIPLVPFTLLSLVCGVARVPVGRFAWTTLVGAAPLTALAVLLGARLQEPSLGDPVLWGTVAAALGLVALAVPVRRRLAARRAS